MDDTALIETHQLTRDYGRIRAVRELSLTLRRGEVLGFLGPNGAGKSTTMQMLSGNLAPTAGSIRIAGIDLLDKPRQAKALLGYLPEQPPLYRELTVDEYLQHCARLHRMRRRARRDALARAKAQCGLEHVSRRVIGNLSKGYQQRVGIAQAILHAPRVVILDEPTVGLDPIQIREIRALIKSLGSERGVILSTHILPEVQATCNRVAIIHQGAIVYDQPLATAIASTRLVAGFKAPPAETALIETPGVMRVEALGEGRFRMHHAPDASPAEALAARAVEHGWGLMELTPERASLEQTFIDLTCGEVPQTLPVAA